MADAIVIELEIVTRAHAKSHGLTHYFSGSLCPKQHRALRFTSNGECSVCAADRQRVDVNKTRARNRRSDEKNRVMVRQRKREQASRKRAKNPELARQKELEYRQSSPLVHADKQRRYVAANREVVACRKKIYRALNPGHEENRARVKAWRIANPDAYLAQVHLRRARKLGADGTYGTEDVSRMLQDQNGLCNGCSCEIWVKYTVDHMMPLSRGGSNWPNNLQLLCKRCNSSKNNRTMEEWLVIKERICLALQTKTSRSCLTVTGP